MAGVPLFFVVIGIGSPHSCPPQMLLWKRLMGTRVLSSQAEGDASSNFAAHVWCANSSAPGYVSGAVTIAFTNGINSYVEVSMQGSKGNFAMAPRMEFILTAPGTNLTSTEVLLNGQPLVLEADGTVGEGFLNGTEVGTDDPNSQQLLVPPLSYGFVVLSAADVSLCGAETAIAAAVVKAVASTPLLSSWTISTSQTPEAVSAGVSGSEVAGTPAAKVSRKAAKVQAARKTSPHALSDFDVERGGAAVVLLLACVAGICTAAQARRVARSTSRLGWQKEGAGQPLIRLDEGAPEGHRPGSRPSSRNKGLLAPIARGSAAAADGGAVWGQFGGENKSALIASHYVYGTLP